jgi:hypothetical protein
MKVNGCHTRRSGVPYHADGSTLPKREMWGEILAARQCDTKILPSQRHLSSGFRGGLKLCPFIVPKHFFQRLFQYLILITPSK